jgi:TonB family protein
MNRFATLAQGPASRPAGRDELAGWAGGLGFTFLLFFGMAHLENLGTGTPPAEIEDLRMVSIPLEPPPPPPRVIETAPAPAELPPLAGIELGASDSTVHIAVVPPDLERLVQASPVPPRALVPFTHFHTEFKPRLDVATDVQRVYRESEVDQPPTAIVRVAPAVPKQLFGDANSLRVVLLLLIEPNGSISSVRVARSSGQPEFDTIVAQTVKEGWEFTPAIRRGKKVRCLAQQPFRVNLGGGNPYEIP